MNDINRIKVPVSTAWSPGFRQSRIPGEAYESINQFDLDTDELRVQRAYLERQPRRVTKGALLPLALLIIFAAAVFSLF